MEIRSFGFIAFDMVERDQVLGILEELVHWKSGKLFKVSAAKSIELVLVWKAELSLNLVCQKPIKSIILCLTS